MLPLPRRPLRLQEKTAKHVPPVELSGPVPEQKRRSPREKGENKRKKWGQNHGCINEPDLAQHKFGWFSKKAFRTTFSHVSWTWGQIMGFNLEYIYIYIYMWVWFYSPVHLSPFSPIPLCTSPFCSCFVSTCMLKEVVITMDHGSVARLVQHFDMLQIRWWGPLADLPHSCIRLSWVEVMLQGRQIPDMK